MSGTDNLGRRRRARTGVIALSSAAAVALLVGLNGSFAQTAPTTTPPAAGQATVVPQQAPAVTEAMGRGYADLVERVSPAVVSISVTRTLPSPTGGGPGGMQDFERFFPEGDLFERFRRFFDERGGGGGGEHGGPGGGERGPGFASGAGSGFIVDPEGYVVTNNHVVGEADEIEVVLQDGRRLKAELVGRDPKTDLALVKVDAGDALPYVKFGDSDRVRVGEQVVAVGNPFGLGGSVTAGIVSARARDLGGPYDDYLQIDASINRGNSGGPTFNLDGEVVGVNSAIFSPSGGNVGIGFAISSNLAQQVIADLREDGVIERGYLGVTIQQVTEDLAGGIGLDEARGALVTRVMPDSPAAQAGVERGDTILSYGGTAVNELRDLTRAVADTKPGRSADMVVWRDGQEQTLEVSVGAMPSEDQMAALTGRGGASEQAQQESSTIGTSLAELNRETRERFGIADDVEGVAVVDVRPDSPAARKGLRAGDVIMEAGQQKVTKPKEVADAVREAAEGGKDSVLLLVHRDQGERFVAVDVQQQAEESQTKPAG
jgi:serine protease Do